MLDDDEESDDEDEQFYQSNTTDLACGRAGIGGRFESTSELKTLNYKEEIASEDKIKWEQEIEIENQRITKYKVWTPVHKKDALEDTEPLASTWVLKNKLNENMGED